VREPENDEPVIIGVRNGFPVVDIGDAVGVSILADVEIDGDGGGLGACV
jgi:hypothetical protein